MFITRSGWYSRMRAATWAASSAFTWAVVIWVLVLPSRSAFRASHLDLVREAMQMWVNRSSHWQHLRMATFGHAAAADDENFAHGEHSFVVG